MIRQIYNKLFRKFSSGKYWENRYAKGDNSGDGSYGRLAEFKADVINEFVKEHSVKSAVELGCGDGHQLSLINYPEYIGLDVSGSIIDYCKNKYKDDESKSFMVHKAGQVSQKSDLALSLDVIYHLVEKNVYTQYLKDLFSLSDKYVIIYSTDFNEDETVHVKHRKFSDDVNTMFPEWELTKVMKNKYPGRGEQMSLADFYFYKKK